MTETKAIYDIEVEEPVVFHCLKCNYPVGIFRHVSGIEVLQVGAFLLREAHGTCLNCGSGIHWDLGERALSRLVLHVLALRDGV